VSSHVTFGAGELKREEEAAYGRTDHRHPAVTEQTFYRWRNKYGGMEVSEARKLKSLEAENAKLKKLVAEQLLAIETLKEFSRGK